MQYKNIFIRSLEIGFEKKNEGISFSQLKTTLTSEGYKFDNKILREWYFSNFEHENRRRFITDPMEKYIMNESDENINPLSSDSFMQYVEYLELKEARESTKKALNHSKYAMYIAVISIILNVFFSESIFGIFGNQQKNTKTDQVLESQAKDELKYQNILPNRSNNQQMILEIQDSTRHEK
jgi:hypothetical protein